MKRFVTLLSAVALLGVTGNAFAQFAGSNLVVSLVDSGDPTKAPSGVATQVRLVAYSRVNGRDVLPTGQTYDLPTVLSGLNHRLTNSGSATSEGEITLSEDGKYLLVVGYDADLGTAAVASTTSLAVNRVVGRIDWTQPQATAIDTTTALNNVYSGSNIRGAVSPDGQTFYLSGSGGTQGGVSLATLGVAAAIPSYGGTTSKTLRDIRLFNGDLYVSAATSGGPLFGVGLVTAGSTTQLSGFPTVAGPSSYGFYFLNPETLYVADDRNTTDGGIQKWQKFGDTWELQYTFNIPAASGTGVVGARGLAGTPFFDEDQATTFAQLYAVTTDNRIVTIIDDQPGETFTVVATGTLSQVFRGVEVIRPTTITVGGMATLDGAEIAPIPITVEFRDQVTHAVLFTRTVTLAADSTYTVTDVPAGRAYNLHIRGINTIFGEHDVNTFSEDDIDADVTLEPGDADGNNTVDVGDFGILINAYGSNSTDPTSGYDPTADFNNDGMVDIADFSLLINNYGLMGDP